MLFGEDVFSSVPFASQGFENELRQIWTENFVPCDDIWNIIPKKEAEVKRRDQDVC